MGTIVRRKREDHPVKTILLPVDQSERMLTALETSRLAANLYGGTVEGVALRPAFTSYVAPDGTFAFDSYPGWNEDEFCHSVRQIFDTFATRHSTEIRHG